MTNTGRIVTGLAVGTVIGATLGLLFAPHKGRKTRSIIADKSREAKGAIGDSFNKAKEMVGLSNHDKKVNVVS